MIFGKKTAEKLTTVSLAAAVFLSCAAPGFAETTTTDTASQTQLAPTGVEVHDIAGYDGLKVSWDKVSGVSSYKVYMAKSRNGSYKLVKTTSSRSAKITGLKTGQKKYFKVRSVVPENTVSTDQTAEANESATDTASSGSDQTDGVLTDSQQTDDQTGGVLTDDQTGSEQTGDTANEEQTTGSTDSDAAAAADSAATAAIASVDTTTSKTVSATPMLDRTKARTSLKTGSKVRLQWKKVKGASGYYVAQRKNGTWKIKSKIRSGSTVKSIRSGASRGRTNRYRVIPYRNVDGKVVRGYAASTSRYVPKKLSRSTSTFSRTEQAKILKTARKKLGRPYVWGAAGPNSFDCSGYVYWVMRHSGVKGVINKRRTAQGYYNAYRRYNIGRSLSKAQPGDVLLFGSGGSRSSIYHVTIYYGGGKMIHASSSSGRIVITNVYRRGNLAAILRLRGLR
ncbi:MAG: NlpC/P60 family protein [Anaerovoracaceae bacterium]|jgi:cell wall-associated NlpC family hydrolase